jgi:hypothetical protein
MQETNWSSGRLVVSVASTTTAKDISSRRMFISLNDTQPTWNLTFFLPLSRHLTLQSDSQKRQSLTTRDLDDEHYSHGVVAGNLHKMERCVDSHMCPQPLQTTVGKEPSHTTPYMVKSAKIALVFYW